MPLSAVKPDRYEDLLADKVGRVSALLATFNPPEALVFPSKKTGFRMRAKFRIWHEKAGFLSRGYEVEITPDGETNISISYGADKFAKFDGPKPKTVVISALR